MRMWMVDLAWMCRRHLLVEHVELHTLVGHLARRRLSPLPRPVLGRLPPSQRRAVVDRATAWADLAGRCEGCRRQAAACTGGPQRPSETLEDLRTGFPTLYGGWEPSGAA